MNNKQKLLEELKDHFPDVLYGVNMHFWDSAETKGILQYGTAKIASTMTAFELCRLTIVKDVVTVSDDQPEYKNYHFVVDDCDENSITVARSVAP